ncbi:MAG: hypothetical protein ABL958_15515 [Bdellovibrionia bacterium]
MSYFLVGFLLAFIVPILVGSWRVGILGLGVQTLLLASMVVSASDHYTMPVVLQLLDLGVLRGVIIPWILVSSVKLAGLPPEFDFVPTNFLYWTGLFFVIGLGLWFGRLLFPDNFQTSLHCGVAAAGILTSFFILALQSSGLGQMFAIILLESSVILFELLSSHQQSYVMQIGVSLLFLILILVFRMFLRRLPILISKDVGEADKDII